MARPEGTWSVLICCGLLASAAAQDSATGKPITGRVVDENGKPIPGAAVGLFRANEFVDTAKLLAKPPAVTGSDGSYTIAAEADFQWGSLAVAITGRQTCALRPLGEGGRNGGTITDAVLPPGARLVGRIRDEAGAGLPGARVCVETSINERSDYSARLLAGAVSDDKGIFAVPCVPRSGLRMTVQADGYLSESRLVAQQSPIDLTLQKVGMVRGKVVDKAGAPLRDIHVHGMMVEVGHGMEMVVTGADGAFALTVPKKGRFRIGGYEQVPPHRRFSSGLLRGAAADVVLTEWRNPERAPEQDRIEVQVVDAGTRSPIGKFQLSEQNNDPANLQMALYHHFSNRRPYEGKAVVELHRQSGRPHAIVVDAPGHGFEVAALPDDLSKPLEIALGPEAVLTGRVIDEETGKPMAGVAVRALPTGTTTGSGGRAQDAGPLSDAEGNYRIAGLRPGWFTMQVHAEGRPASGLASKKLEAGADNKLDLTVPRQRWLVFEASGAMPLGPGLGLTPGASVISGELAGFQHSLTTVPVSITGPGTWRLGPLGGGSFQVQVLVHSRTRVGARMVVDVGSLDPAAAPTKLDLGDYATRRVTGRVDVPKDVPTERLAVLAVHAKKPAEFWMLSQPAVAGVDGDGGFTFDLPAGPYCLQLVDLLTGIVFHTEEQDLSVGKDPAPVSLRPEFRWLAVECVPEREGEEVVLRQFSVQLSRPRRGSAFQQTWYGSNKIENGSVDFRLGAASQRWLVPAGAIQIKAAQTFDVLKPWGQGWQTTPVANADLEIDKPEQTVTLKIPAPPSDDELLRRK